MSETRLPLRTAVARVVAIALVVAGAAAVAPPGQAPASAADGTTVTADPLPTVQVDGVVWDQAVIGSTVYVVGEFQRARPAGAAPGSSTVTRKNILAYDINTGALISSFAPTLNAAGLAVEASPDGTILYIGGNFTYVNSTYRGRFAALNPTTGALITKFVLNANSAVRTIEANATNVFFGGNFGTVNGQNRPRLASAVVATGALRSWRVSAQAAQVEAMVLTADQTRLIVGGRFERLNSTAAKGHGAVSPSTGAVLRWDANTYITNYGYDAGITDLDTDGTLIYASGFKYLTSGQGWGNLEGTFAADPATGAIRWIADCHGDTYAVWANPGGDHIYLAGHPYYCQNLSSFPEASPRFHHYVMAETKADHVTITPDTKGYFNFAGNRGPAIRTWWPDLKPGTYTGQNQGAWDITGTANYVLAAGEFPSINGIGQQGLVRFARSALAPDREGPRLTGSALTPAAASLAAGSVQISWPTNWDRDDANLTYSVRRGSTTVYSVTASSRFWDRPRLSFTDTGLTNGQTYSYTVVASDATGNSVTSPSVSVKVASSGTLSTYARTVLAGNPSVYLRLGESSGVPRNWTGHASGGAGSGVVRGVTGAITGDADRAMRFGGTSASRVWTTAKETGSNFFTVEAWFRTTTTRGGKIVGFSSATSSTSSTSDRHVYMTSAGTLVYGVNPNVRRTITTPTAYNDGKWHHVVATLGTGGMALYVDGNLVASQATTTSARNYGGYWRVGGDSLSGWPSVPPSADFAGDIDEFVVYGRPLSLAEVRAHYTAATGKTF